MSPAPPRWRVLTHALGDLTLVRLSGSQLDLGEADALWLRDRLLELVEAGRHQLALDLGNVRFLTSTLIEALLGLHRRLKACGGRISVFNLTPPVAEVFAVLKLADVLDVRTSPPQNILEN